MKGYPHPPEVRDEAIRRMEAGESPLTVGADLGVARATIYQWKNDPTGEQNRARKERYRGTCVDCGSPTDGSNGPGKASQRCASCDMRHRHETRRWTPEAIVEAVREWAEEHGCPPTATEWRSGGPDHPATSTVIHIFGWNAALRAAGLEPLREFDRPYAKDPSVLDRAVAMYEAGFTLTEVAEAFGVSPTRVQQWLEKAGVSRRSRWESRCLREAREQVAA